MTSTEFDILDELYFVISFAELISKLGISNLELKSNLQTMLEKGWVNYYQELDGEANPSMEEIFPHLEKLYFLASKKGLFAHNSK